MMMGNENNLAEFQPGDRVEWYHVSGSKRHAVAVSGVVLRQTDDHTVEVKSLGGEVLSLNIDSVSHKADTLLLRQRSARH